MITEMASGSIFAYEILILERHLDTFGHVNNATYLEIFEEARWDFCEKRGFGFHHIKSEKQGPIVLEVNLKFLKEILLRQRVTIMSQSLDYNGKVGKLRQWIKNEQDEVCCEAVFSFALFDWTTRKIIPPTPKWLDVVGLGDSAQ